MRTPLIAGNWKMNTNLAEAQALAEAIVAALQGLRGVEVLLCPPFMAIGTVRKAVDGSQVKVGAQNMHHQAKGAFTGEIASAMLTGLCEYVILGHSERRLFFHEDDALVNKKVAAALKAGLSPILAVGERLDEREAGKMKDVITRQVQGGLNDIPKSNDLVIAYEPVWAIGTGRAASPADATETIRVIREVVAIQYGQPFANQIRVLYGGSVTSQNIAQFMAESDIDGGLVGGASLMADEFVSIAKQAAQARKE